MYVRTYKGHRFASYVEALCNSHETCRFAMQYYVMFCLCTELKICHEVMCKRTFANIRKLFANARDTFAKLCKVFLQSTVSKFKFSKGLD